MTVNNRLLVAFLALLMVLASGFAARAQDQPGPDEEPAVSEAEVPEEEAEAAEEEQPAEPTNADRLLSLERQLEEDQQKLDELEGELEQWKGYYEILGQETLRISKLLDDDRLRLEGLDPEADAAEVEKIREWIARQEMDLELFTTQSDLLLLGESALREQMALAEEGITLMEQTRDNIRGVAPATAAGEPEAVAPVTTAPAGRPAIPLLPGMPATPTAAAPEQIQSRLETPEQIRALRELERIEGEMANAEQLVLEHVKRRELAERYVDLEQQLLEAARGTRENLLKLLDFRHQEMERKIAAEATRQEIRELEHSEAKITNYLAMAEKEIEERNEYLVFLGKRLEELGPIEEMVTREAEEKREEVRDARNLLYWLQSPLHPRNVLQWVRVRGPRMLLALVVTGVLLLLLRIFVRRAARLLVRGGHGARDRRGANRADTLAFSFRSAFSVLIMIGGVLLVLQEAGLDIRTVLGGAAILGVAIAFGAQNLMRDYFTGFLILLEDQYELGDLITIGAITGTVESVNMRITVLRDLEGRVHFIPNGEIKAVTNRTYSWGRAVIEVPLGFKEDVDRAMKVLLEVCEELGADPTFGDWIEDDPVMLGVDKFTEFGVVIKFMLKTRPDKMFPVRRELLRRVKNRLDKEGIDISVPHRMVQQQPSAD